MGTQVQETNTDQPRLGGHVRRSGSERMTTDNDQAEGLLELLRAVKYPGFRRDIVAAGFVKSIEVEGKCVTVHFVPNTRDQAKVVQMEADIRDTLDRTGRFERIEIERRRPDAASGVLSDDGKPETEIKGSALRRPDMAPQSGYDEDGPEPLGGPRSDVYEGELPVFQWEIDPHDSAAKSGTANLTIGKWDFRVWWQVHPARLVYASIQALREDWVEHGGEARSHPVGRSEAVNIVYDTDRKAVVAIYGTVADFRPFVDAFYRGYVLKN